MLLKKVITLAADTNKANKTMERKKVHLEYLLNATSKHILWTAISTPTGLEGWFADKVQSNDKIVTFFGERPNSVRQKL